MQLRFPNYTDKFNELNAGMSVIKILLGKSSSDS